MPQSLPKHPYLQPQVPFSAALCFLTSPSSRRTWSRAAPETEFHTLLPWFTPYDKASYRPPKLPLPFPKSVKKYPPSYLLCFQLHSSLGSEGISNERLSLITLMEETPPLLIFLKRTVLLNRRNISLSRRFLCSSDVI